MRAALPHYHETVDFTTELESGSTFAVDVGRRYTVFAYVSDVIYPPISSPRGRKRRAPADTVVKVTVTGVEAAPRGERAPAASSGLSALPVRLRSVSNERIRLNDPWW